VKKKGIGLVEKKDMGPGKEKAEFKPGKKSAPGRMGLSPVRKKIEG
jgi:hypothetical protein